MSWTSLNFVRTRLCLTVWSRWWQPELHDSTLKAHPVSWETLKKRMHYPLHEERALKEIYLPRNDWRKWLSSLLLTAVIRFLSSLLPWILKLLFHSEYLILQSLKETQIFSKHICLPNDIPSSFPSRVSQGWCCRFISAEAFPFFHGKKSRKQFQNKLQGQITYIHKVSVTHRH